MDDMRATASQIFAASIHNDDNAMLTQRRRAAAAFSAPLTPMSDLLRGERGRSRRGAPLEGMPLRECATEAIRLARGGRRSLFLTRDAALTAKALQCAAARLCATEGEPKDAQREWLALVQLRQCRDVFELLRAVAAVDARTSETQLDAIAVGPLVRFFSPFATTGGLTTGGEGLLRALHLALKRLRSASGAAIFALEPDADLIDTTL